MNAFACILFMVGAVTAHALDSEPIGNGDGRIHIIPMLSHASIKNGETLSVQAIVKAQAGVASVEAIIERESAPSFVDAGLNEHLGLPVVRLTLGPAPENLGGVNDLGTMGMWQADWKAYGLEEAWYRVTITVTDTDGHQYSDASLRFSDPISGNDAIGTVDYPDGGMRRLDALDLSDEPELVSAVIDPANGYAYFGTQTPPGRVVKVALGVGNNPPTRVGAVTLEAEEVGLLSGVIDPIGGHAYFGTATSPGRVVKVALGAGNDPPSRVGAVTLENEEDSLFSGVIDPIGGHAYFGTATSPGRVVKVALGAGSDPPSRVGAVILEDGEDELLSAVIDPVGGHAYFGTFGIPGQVVKVALGAGSDPPSRVGAVTLEDGEDRLWSAVIDPIGGHAYFGTYTSPGRVVKVALGVGNLPPTRVGAVTLDDGVDFLFSAVVDPANGYAYFGTDFSLNRVVKVALGAGSNPPTQVGVLTLEGGDGSHSSAVIDPESGYAYFGTETTPGRVVRVALSQQGFVKGTRLTMPEFGVVEEARFYSHEASGNVRLGLYDDNDPPVLLWQSGVIANTAEEDWLAVPISDGTPSSLALPPDDYWLAWQVDTMAPVPSYTTGSLGSGLLVPKSFGSFPATLEDGENSEPTLSDETWSAYLVYETDTVPPNAVSIIPATTGPTNANSIDFTVEFDEDVQNFDDASDLVVTHSGTASTGAVITGGPTTYSVSITGISGDGSFTLAVSTESNVEDLAGNPLESSVTSAPVVIDNTPPDITLIGANPLFWEAATSPFLDPGATATDAVDGTLTGQIVVTGSVNTSFLGQYQLLYNVSDSSGNAATEVVRTVIVEDTTPPVITRIGPESVTVEAGAVYTDAGATAQDSFEGDLTANIVVTNPVNTSELGVYTVRYNVSDSSGNAATEVIRTVTVEDTTPPNAVSIIPSTTGPTNANSIDFAVTFDEPVVNFSSAADIVIAHTGTSNTGVSISEGPAVYTVTITGVAGDGSFSLAVNTQSDVQDLSGNPLATSASSAAVTIDNTPPSRPIILTNDGISFVTPDPSVTLEGTASLDTQTILVNGQAIPYTIGSGQWSVDLPIPGEIALFRFVAVDAATNTSPAATITIFRDLDGDGDEEDPVEVAVFGTIRDAETGLPITCGAIELIPSDNSYRVSAVTDLNGEYFFEPQPPDSYNVRILAPGFAVEAQDPIVIDGTDPIRADFSVLPRATTNVVGGRVVDEANGRPLVGVIVRLFIGSEFFADTVSCADGRYEISLSPTKDDELLEVEIEFSLPNYETERVFTAVNPAVGAIIDEELKADVLGIGAIAGQVLGMGTSNSTPLADARVTLRGEVNTSTFSDSEGFYSFDTLLNGSYSVSASATGYLGRTRQRTLTASAPVREASFQLTPVLVTSPPIPGDINGTGVVNAVDVQLVINAALGLDIEYNADINGDGVINAVDVQLVINAALGIEITVK